MTRLTDEWMAELITELPKYQQRFYKQTGLDFAAASALCAGISKDSLPAAAKAHTVAAIPVSAGQGEIGGFAAAAAAIADAAGFCAFTTDAPDVDGIYEAHMRGADILLMADDARYIALRTDRRIIADNDHATALGYTRLLEHVAGGLTDKYVLVLGCGIIGRLAGEYLLALGAHTVYYDSDAARLADMAARYPVERDISCTRRYELIFDATNTGGWLTADMLSDTAYVAAPGVPCSLTADAMARHGERVLHDKLHIGTLAMLGLCVKG